MWKNSWYSTSVEAFYRTVNSISGQPSTPAVITSPDVTGPTPEGVPVNTRSPGSRVNIPLIWLIKSATWNSMSLVLPFCFNSPFTFSHIPKSCTSFVKSDFGTNSPTGHDVSNPLETAHGNFLSFNSVCFSRSVMSRATVYPAMWSVTADGDMSLHFLPITTPSSTSWCSSVAPLGS